MFHGIGFIPSSSGGGGNNGPYTLDITTDGNGTITLSNPGPYYYGDVVLVNATPNSGYLFNAWTGGLTGSANPYSLTVTQNVTAVATFQAPSGNAVGLVRNLHSVEVDSEQLLDVPIEVTVVDSSQNPVSVEVDIRAEIYSGNGILLGTKTLTSQAGVAVFSDLAIQGAGYVTLLFTSPGLNPILSAAILVNNVGTNSQSLRIDTQPSGAVSGSPLTQQPNISTVDINGDIIVGSVNVITVSLLSGNAVLSGTTSLTATDGFVAFTDLVLTGPSGPVVLQFTSPGITTATSLTFNLVNNGNNLPLSGNFPIRPKSSITANKAPTTSDLVAYELAVNLADQKIYMRDGANKVYLVGDVSSGSSTPLLDSLGNVTITNKTTHDLLEWNGTSWVNLSPSGLLGSGTKNFLARWDGNGKLETSGVLDSGTHITSANASIGRWASNTYTQFAHSDLFSPTASTNYALLQSNTGVTFLNSTGALHFRQSNAEVAAFNQGNLLIGYADGDTTTYKVDIKGTLHATGDTTLDKLAGTGSRMVLADASGTLSTDAIPEGTVTSVALSSDSKELTITGSPVTDSGTIDLALSATGVTAGSYTHASVTVDASGRITSASSGDTASLKAGTGISISGTYPEFTITNEAPDQTVTLTAGSGIEVTGTYPTFTVNSSITQYTDSDARKALSAGTGISYDSTTGVISNSSPDQTVVLSAGTGISTSGTYPSFTITNNAPDQVVKLTAGSGISTSGTYPDFTISSTLTQYTDTMARSALSAGTGISYNSTTGVISNASPDQTVVLTAGSGITTSGTYPNFTITSTITQYTDSDARKSLSAGTGISYNSSTGTITNSNPDQIVTLTAGTGISVTGTYPSFTITNSSTSSGGTVTSVDLSVPTGFKVSGNPVTTSGKLALTFDTGYALPTTASQTTWDTAYANRITSLTTTGSSGSATLSANTLNIPTYTLAGLGGQASSTNLTSLSGLTYTAASFVKMTGAGTFALDTSTYLTTNQTITLSGDVTGSGTTAITATLATVGATKGGTGQTTYTLGDTLYSSAANTLAKLTGNTTTTKKFLRQTGTGTASAAPAWDTVTSSDVGLGNVENTALSTWIGTANITTVGTLGALNVAGTTTINGLTYPAVDGTSGQTLVTDGAGTLSWATGSGASAAGSTGDLQYNDGSGGFTASSYFSYGSSAYDALSLYSNNASFGVFGIFAASGQTYPLLEFRDYTGATVYSYFDATGHLYLNAQKNVRFADADSSHYAAIQAPATIATNYTLTLPTTAGTSGYVMTTNGSGALSWTNATNANTASALIKRDASGDFSTGKITLEGSGSSTLAQLAFTGSTNNWIDLGTNGYAAPAFTTRSVGTKVVFYKDISASSTDYAAGIEINALWFSVPAATAARSFKFYGGTTNIASLTGEGNFSANKKITGETLGSTVATGTAPITVTSTTQVTNLNASFLEGYSTANANTASTIVRRDASGNFSAGTITATLSGNATNVSGTVAIANGGTGQTTATAAFNALAPSQTSNSGKYLTTDGTNTSWGTVSAGTTLPAGCMQMFGGSITQSVSSGTLTTTAPSGWALCDGSAVSRTTYSALFSAIGTTYGVGNGSSTFNLPDFRSRSPIGGGQGSGLTSRTLGTSYGAESVTLASNQIPTLTTGNQLANHTHSATKSYWNNSSSAPYTFTGGGSAIGLDTPTTGNESANHTHQILNLSQQPTSVLHPTLTVHYIIKL